RVVVHGADGSTLDEVIEPAAVRVRGRQGRLNVGDTRAAVVATTDVAPPAHIRDLYVGQWDRIRPALEDALRARADEVRDQRGRKMDAKRDAEEKRLRQTLIDLQAAMSKQLAEFERKERVEQMSFWEEDERRRFNTDVKRLRERVDQLEVDVDKEVGI